jgi:hypothetical protein
VQDIEGNWFWLDSKTQEKDKHRLFRFLNISIMFFWCFDHCLCYRRMHNIKTPASNFKKNESNKSAKTRWMDFWPHAKDRTPLVALHRLFRFSSLSLSLSLSLARHFVRGTSFSLCAWGKRVFAESVEGLVVSFVLVASAERGDTFCTELRAWIATFYAESSYTSNLPQCFKIICWKHNSRPNPWVDINLLERAQELDHGKDVLLHPEPEPWKNIFLKTGWRYIKKGDIFLMLISRLKFIIIY